LDEDIELRVPRFTPRNVVSTAIFAALRRSRFRAPDALQMLGFSSVEFASRNGSTRITLHIGDVTDGTPWFVPRAGNIASVLLGVVPADGPSLAVFDTGRGRIGAPLLVSPRSLDDPDSALSIAVGLVPGILALGGRAAGDPLVGSTLAKAFPALATHARRWHGTESDGSIRIAHLESLLPHGSSCFIRLGREDRRFEPPPYGNVPHAQRWQYVVDKLQAAAGDIDGAWTGFAGRHKISNHSLSYFFVRDKWRVLTDRALTAFAEGRTVPLSVQLLGIHDGPLQFVRRIARGEEL
jgi:hypothetical protein